SSWPTTVPACARPPWHESRIADEIRQQARRVRLRFASSQALRLGNKMTAHPGHVSQHAVEPPVVLEEIVLAGSEPGSLQSAQYDLMSGPSRALAGDMHDHGVRHIPALPPRAARLQAEVRFFVVQEIGFIAPQARVEQFAADQEAGARDP